MEIIKLDNNPSFGSVSIGALFYFRNEIFMKTHSFQAGAFTHNAQLVGSVESTFIPKSEQIILVKKITVE